MTGQAGDVPCSPRAEGGIRRLVDGRFRFACHPGVDCFNECCADLRLVLTPYDILRIQSRLNLSSEEFLARYTVPHWERGSPFPKLLLKMEEGGRRPCPFVREEGCAIYPDRPGACRLYPVGRGASAGGLRGMEREFYFLVEEPHCHGFREPVQWSLEEWLQSQGAWEYNEMNRPWMELVTSTSPRLQSMSAQSLQMFYMASYNLDQFRSFVFTTRFLQRFRLTEEEVEKVKEDRTALMLLAMRWLKFAILGAPTMELRGA